MQMRGERLLVIAALFAATTVAAESDLLVCDRDAHQVAVDRAGAIFGVDRAAAPDSPPRVIAAADLGALFEDPSEIVVSPTDGTVYVIDLQALPPAIVLETCGGTTRTVTRSSALSYPFNAEALPDGTLLIADSEADPARLGPDTLGGAGHGCLWRLDPSTGVPSVISDGTLHDVMPGASSRSCFEDPSGVTFDAASGTAFVTDASADPLGVGNLGAVFAVRLSDGHVSLVSSTPGFSWPISCARRADGSLVVLDPGFGPGDTVIFRVEAVPTDPSVNAAVISGGTQYSEGTDIAVDAANQVVVLDWGEYDGSTGTFIVAPAIFVIDDADPDPLTNARIVHRSLDMLSPLSIALGPGCAFAPARMAINRRVVGPMSMAAVRSQFDAACRSAPWVVCPEGFADGFLAGMTLPGEATSVPGSGVSFYEHSDVTLSMRVSKVGNDLVFRAD